jgi:hypothetical protein
LFKRIGTTTLIGLFAVACTPSPGLTTVPLSATPGVHGPFRTQATSSVGPSYTAFTETTGQPGDWTDVIQDVSPAPSWLYPGDWSRLPSAPGFSGGVYHQAETGPHPHVMIRRYAGAAFGPDGRMPARYRISAAVQPFENTTFNPLIGDNSLLVYYRDPTHYVELVVSSGNISVWTANDGTPFSSAGWTGHYWYAQQTSVGDIRRLSAEVDTTTHQLTFWVEGRKAATLTVPMLTDDVYHGVALRALDNAITYGELVIDDLTAGPSPSPSPVPSPTPSPTISPPPTPTPTPSAGLSLVPTGTLPRGLAWHRAAATADSVYVTGGSNGSQSFSSVWRSPLQQPWIWQEMSPLPLPTEGHGFAIVGTHAFVIGGWGRGSAPRATVYRADIQPDGSLGTWQEAAPLPQGRAFHSTIVDGDRIVVIGGWNPNYATTTTVWTSTVDADGNLAGWQVAPSLPARRAWAAACLADGKLIVTGGIDGSQTQAGTFEASYTNGQIGPWQAGADLPARVQAHGCILIDGRPTTLGGADYVNNTAVATNAIYQLINGSWQTAGQLPTARFAHATLATGGVVSVLGGHDAQQRLLTGIDGTSGPVPTPTPAPTATPTPVPTAAPSPDGYTYAAPIAGTAAAELPDWPDVTGPAWLEHDPWPAANGLWHLPAFTGAQYGFRTYTGAAYRPEGGMPDLYQVTYRIKPTTPGGQIAVLPYYLDPTHYVMVQLDRTNRNVSLWQIDGGTPTSGNAGAIDLSQKFRGWQPLPPPDSDGAYTVRIRVNAIWHSLAVWVGGTWIDTPYVADVRQQAHTIGIRSNGTPQDVTAINVLRYDDPGQAR